MKHGEFRKQPISVMMIPGQNVNEITYGCCARIVVVNKTGSCTLDVLKTVGLGNVVEVPSLQRGCGRIRG